MIKGLTGGPSIVVSGGSTSFPYVPYNSNNPIQGMLRLNGQDLQVFDGSTWMNLGSSYASVDLSPDVKELLEWAKAQRTIYMRRLEAAQKNPALLKALEAIKRAEENFDLLDAISKDYSESDVQAGP
jgi:hypothetical protein